MQKTPLLQDIVVACGHLHPKHAKIVFNSCPRPREITWHCCHPISPYAREDSCDCNKMCLTVVPWLILPLTSEYVSINPSRKTLPSFMRFIVLCNMHFKLIPSFYTCGLIFVDKKYFFEVLFSIGPVIRRFEFVVKVYWVVTYCESFVLSSVIVFLSVRVKSRRRLI